VKEVKGGILADQMGLGKTAEVISLILAHPKPPQHVTPPEEIYPNVTMQEDSENLGETRCYCGQAEEAQLADDTQVCCEYCRSWQHTVRFFHSN